MRHAVITRIGRQWAEPQVARLDNGSRIFITLPRSTSFSFGDHIMVDPASLHHANSKDEYLTPAYCRKAAPNEIKNFRNAKAEEFRKARHLHKPLAEPIYI
jgi:hypothetical protein